MDVGLGSAAFIDDPYPAYRILREADPVHWSEAWGVWVVTRYDDVVALLKDPVTYSNRDRFSAMAEMLPGDVQAQVQPLVRHNSVGMLQSDPPDHTRLRRLVRDVFTPRVIESIRLRVQEIVDGILDAAALQGHIEVVHDLAYRLPMQVICELLGVPPRDHEQFFAWAEAVSSFQATGKATATNALRAATATLDVEAYFDRLCAHRRGGSSDDLIGVMMAAEDAGDRLGHEELINMSVNLLFAGHETTKSLIANGLLTLLRHPGKIDDVEGGRVVAGSVIEECLRFESPIQRAWRRVARDHDMAGRTLREGQLVFMMLGSANRDERRFPDPDSFLPFRPDNRHVAFGYGIHFCIGAPLARIEAPIAISTLLRRFPAARLAGDVTWNPNVHVRSPRSLVLDLMG